MSPRRAVTVAARDLSRRTLIVLMAIAFMAVGMTSPNLRGDEAWAGDKVTSQYYDF